jgi:hypothetical protein
MERFYHLKWTKEEITILAERYCEEVIDDLTRKIQGDSQENID